MVPSRFSEEDNSSEPKNQKERTVIVKNCSYAYPESCIINLVFCIQTGSQTIDPPVREKQKEIAKENIVLDNTFWKYGKKQYKEI